MNGAAPVEYTLLPNTYYDSVYLMGLAGKLSAATGVLRTSVLMASPNNKPLLIEFGLPASALDAAGPSDLVIAVEANSSEEAVAALSLVAALLQQETAEFDERPVATLDSALQQAPDANLAVISVPGEYAAYEAKRAIEHGLNVFIFSDNVSLEDELALKREAAARGLIVMGPDCGTAIIAGTGIGFANAVRPGPIGITGPSGTGIQQVSSLIDNAGYGISHAIGTGGRDLSDDIGGISTLQALNALAHDDATRVIVVVSKPPGPRSLRRVLGRIATSEKPVVTCFLGLGGSGVTTQAGPQHIPVLTLAEASFAAIQAVRTLDAGVSATTGQLRAGNIPPRAPQATAACCVRGLFAGGTFCYEAQQIFLDAGIEVRSNVPLRRDLALGESRAGDNHIFIDLGDDEFTRGRPHPMIDAGLRNERIITAARDAGVGLILLDFILGYGAAADPAGAAASAIREAQRIAVAAGRSLAFVASVCGTDADIQDRVRQVTVLEELGVMVLQSNAQAAEIAASFVLAAMKGVGTGA